MATQMAALRNLTHYRMGFRVAVAAAAIGLPVVTARSSSPSRPRPRCVAG